MQFETAADNGNVVGQQGRGQRIAGKTTIAPAVETKRNRPRSINTPTGT
jgi:hypothetical protein